jgi:hypothetical protein
MAPGRTCRPARGTLSADATRPRPRSPVLRPRPVHASLRTPLGPPSARRASTNPRRDRLHPDHEPASPSRRADGPRRRRHPNLGPPNPRGTWDALPHLSPAVRQPLRCPRTPPAQGRKTRPPAARDDSVPIQRSRVPSGARRPAPTPPRAAGSVGPGNLLSPVRTRSYTAPRGRFRPTRGPLFRSHPGPVTIRSPADDQAPVPPATRRARTCGPRGPRATVANPSRRRRPAEPRGAASATSPPSAAHLRRPPRAQAGTPPAPQPPPSAGPLALLGRLPLAPPPPPLLSPPRPHRMSAPSRQPAARGTAPPRPAPEPRPGPAPRRIDTAH